MSRWGGDETKTQGTLGCAIAGIILLAAGWTAYKAYPAMSKRAAFEKQVNKILRGAIKLKESEIESKIMESAKNIGLPVLREDLELSKTRKDKYTPVIEAYISIRAEVDFGWGPKMINLPPIKAEVTLISF